jgi:signal transduction histidine kinase
MTAAAPLSVLLVEDNPGDARLLELLLHEGTLDHELIRAARLEQGLALLEQRPVDVILLDLSLPDGQGMDTVRRMLGSAGHAPIVVLTGLDDERVAVEAVQAGAQDYLVKGRVDSTLLVRSVRYAIERKRLERERARLLVSEQAARATAEAAVRARDEVLRVVSHDLGNSLSAVAVQAVLIERTPRERLDDAALLKRTTAIRNLVAGMQKLRQDLLDVASIEAGRLSVEAVPFDPAPALEEAFEVHHALAEQGEIELRLDVEPGLPRILADRARLMQVLGNLLGNALKFTSAGGTVHLTCVRGEGCVRLAVRDSGQGIAAADLPHIFDRFWKSGRGNRAGAGLGLAIARGIVEAHTGRMWAESQEGVGSVFHFELPIAREERAEET